MKFIEKMKRILAVLMVCLALSPGLSVAGAHAQEKPFEKRPKLGGELDVLPYATKGYYGSGFIGCNGWKFRSVVARTNVPSFLVSDGYRDKRTDAYALLADRFLGSRRKELKGAWIGGGAEYWQNRIRTTDSPDYVHYLNYMATIGGGYVWELSRHFYVNPWSGAHFVVAHSRDVQVSGTLYKQPLFTPETSVKIGIVF